MLDRVRFQVLLDSSGGEHDIPEADVADKIANDGYVPKFEAGLIPKLDDDGHKVLDNLGNPVLVAGMVPILKTKFEPRLDDAGQGMTRSYFELQGLGLGSGTSFDGTTYQGVEYENFEFLRLRLDDRIDDTAQRANTSDLLTIKSTHAGLTEVALGGGDDTVNVEGIDGETIILGGGGDDVINVHDPVAHNFDNINARLLFDGDAHFQEIVKPLQYNATLHDAVLGTAPFVFINTDQQINSFEVDVQETGVQELNLSGHRPA